MPKTKTKKVVKELPIAVRLTVNKVTTEHKTDNLFNFVRDLKIDPNIIHFRTGFQVTFKGKTLTRNFTIGQFRAMLGKDNNRTFAVKYFNTFLGIQ